MFDVPSRKRQGKHSPQEFVGCAAARLRDGRRAVYGRVRNADGKWSVKTFPVKFSDVHEIFTERQMNAAMSAQSHYDAHHVPAPRRKSRGPRARGSRDGEAKSEEDGSDGDELVSVEEEEEDATEAVAAEKVVVAAQDWPEDWQKISKPSEAASASGVNDKPSEAASASGVNDGAAQE